MSGKKILNSSMRDKSDNDKTKTEILIKVLIKKED